MPFPARYPGRCPECAERVEEGDYVTMTEAGAVHADCSEETYRYHAERPAAVCGRCNLTKPCECEDD